jgi:hypothetical protein
VAHMGERRGEYRVLIGRPEGKRPLGIVSLGSTQSLTEMSTRNLTWG